MDDTTAPIIPTGTYYHATAPTLDAYGWRHLVAMADGTGRYVVVYDDGSHGIVSAHDVTLAGDIALCEDLDTQAMYAGQLQRALAALTAPAATTPTLAPVVPEAPAVPLARLQTLLAQYPAEG